MTDYGKDWGTLIENYRTHLRFERKLSKNTIEAYMRDVGQFRGFIEKNYDILPGEVGNTHIEAYMSEIYERGMKSASQARQLSGLKSFFVFLQIAEVTESSRAEFVDTPKIGR